MFNPENEQLVKPDSNNEYFIDRNGELFHYVLEFYRNHGIHLPSLDLTGQYQRPLPFSRAELLREFDFFQIPYAEHRTSTAYSKAGERLDCFLSTIEESVLCRIEQVRYLPELELKFYDYLDPMESIGAYKYSQPPEFEKEGYHMLELFEDE